MMRLLAWEMSSTPDFEKDSNKVFDCLTEASRGTRRTAVYAIQVGACHSQPRIAREGSCKPGCSATSWSCEGVCSLNVAGSEHQISGLREVHRSSERRDRECFWRLS